MHTSPARRRVSLGAIVSLLLLASIGTACSSDEATAPESGHTPASAKLFVNDVDVTANLVLPAGATTPVEVRFYAADGDLITGIETDHFAGLTFTAPTLATPVAVAGHHFQFDVTAQATSGNGTVDVGYGHEASADDLIFGPFVVTVP